MPEPGGCGRFARRYLGAVGAGRLRALLSWRWYLAGGLLLIDLFFAVHHLEAKVALFDGVGAACVVAVLSGPRRRGDRAVRAWTLLAAGAALQLVGGIVYQTYELGGGRPPQPSLADLFFLLSYPCFIAGAVGLVRLRAPGQDWPSLIDSTIVAVGVGVAAWLLSGPADLRHGVFVGAVALAYPALDALLLGVIVRLLFGLGVPAASVWCLLASSVSLLVSDVVVADKQLSSWYAFGGIVDGGFLLALVLLAVSALHPSARTLTDRAAPGRRRLVSRRLILVACAAIAAPLVLVASGDDLGWVRVTVIAAASVAITLLALARAFLAIVERERDLAREVALRRSATALIEAADREAVAGVVLGSVAFWASGAVAARVYLRDHGEFHAAIAVPPAGASPPVLSPGIVRALEAEDGAVLADIPEAVSRELALPAEARSLLVVPVPVAHEAVGALLVAGVAPFSLETRAGLRLVCVQAGRALGRAPSAQARAA